MSDRIRFITHEGKQILLIDLANCSGAEIARVHEFVSRLVE